MRSSVGHGYAGIQKFNTLMNIPKRMIVKTVTKKLKKMIDSVNFVDCFVDLLFIKGIEIIKLECVKHYHKQVGTRLQNLKEKKGLVGKCRLTDATIDRR